MRFFIDTANVDEIRAANDMGGYLVLRCQEEVVLGYPSGWRTFGLIGWAR